MRVLVTGAAGFIGSHTVEALSKAGHQVEGVDSFNDYYDPAVKRRNAAEVYASTGIEIREADLAHEDLDPHFRGLDAVVHLAGQPGVRNSWDTFAAYLASNVALTEALLQACLRCEVGRLVYASSSSVYGNSPAYPVSEDDLTVPSSPYGVTKLGGELLCRAYAENFGLSTISLRYFTVYGPRQRPDMAIQRLILAGQGHSSFSLFGDGTQIRDFTYVADVAEANVLAVRAAVPGGSVLNISGGSATDMRSVIAEVGVALRAPIDVRLEDSALGDVRQTGGNNRLARDLLGWSPTVSLAEGIAAQVLFETQ